MIPMVKTILVSALLFSTGCSVFDKEARIKNDYGIDLKSVMVGDTEYENVAMDEITDYNEIKRGSLRFTAEDSQGKTLSDFVHISGSNTQYTIVVKSGGSIEVINE